MKLHTMQSNLKALDPAMMFTAAQILRTLDYAVEEVDAALKLSKRNRSCNDGRRNNGKQTVRHLEETACYLRGKGYTHREIGERLDIPQPTITKICERGGV